VSKGAVRIGGVDVRDIAPESLRDRIGVLFQDYASYELSVRENVVMGARRRARRPPRTPGAEGLAQRVAGEQDAQGLDSKVGRLFEGGTTCRRRMAAPGAGRIMYRNADIWILDEPTSSLDPEAEAAIFAELKESLRGGSGS